jgi:hypothetical protein
LQKQNLWQPLLTDNYHAHEFFMYLFGERQPSMARIKHPAKTIGFVHFLFSFFLLYLIVAFPQRSSMPPVYTVIKVIWGILNPPLYGIREAFVAVSGVELAFFAVLMLQACWSYCVYWVLNRARRTSTNT